MGGRVASQMVAENRLSVDGVFLTTPLKTIMNHNILPQFINLKNYSTFQLILVTFNNGRNHSTEGLIYLYYERVLKTAIYMSIIQP